MNLALIDYLSQKILSNPTIGETCKPSTLLGFLSGLANADYKPDGWDSIKQIVVRNPVMEKQVNNIYLFNFLRITIIFCICFNTENNIMDNGYESHPNM